MIVRKQQKSAPCAGAKAMLAGALALACVVPVTAAAQDAGAVPDAQVEANVLKALAAAPELSTQNIQSSTVYGIVTLTGTVQTEDLRSRAENLVARASGVKKVVDEMTLGNPGAASASTQTQDDSQQPAAVDPNGNPIQADGTYAPQSPAPPATPYGANTTPLPSQPGSDPQGQQAGNQPQPAYPDPNNNPPNSAQSPYAGQPGYGQQPGYNQPQQPGYPQQSTYPQQPNNQPQQGYPQQQPGYPQPGYPQPTYPQPEYPQQPQYSQAPPQQPYSQPQPYAQSPIYAAPQGGQQAGLGVTVPAGALLRVRINRGLDSNHIQPGTPFDGTVLSDIPAAGVIAIPRGASVSGVVVDAKKAGALSGHGELSLQINSLTLGGATYPVLSDVWQQVGRDKTATTVNSALGLGALGAIIGGVAGGGAGAAIGAGVGAGAGVAGSASSPSGRIVIPPEAVLTFHLAQPAAVRTVSEQEMQRLAYAAGPGLGQPPVVRRRYYYGYGAYPPPPPPAPPYAY